MSDSESDRDNESVGSWGEVIEGLGDGLDLSSVDDDDTIVKSSKVMTRDEVHDVLYQLANEVAEMLELPHDLCVHLLYAFRWDSAETTSAYLESPSDALSKIGLSPSSLKLRLAPSWRLKSTEKYSCPVCLETKPQTDTFTLGCEHSVCTTCFKNYLQTNVVDDRKVFDTRCPGAHNCPLRVLRSDVAALLSPPELRIYDRFWTQIFIDQNHPKFRQCPAPGCHYIIESSSNTSVPCVKCNCGCEFCPECGLEGNHLALPCDIANKWKQLLYVERQSEKWLADNAKKCGKCQALIQRSYGCNHMVCSACGYSFCWICLKSWDSHPGNSLYNCMKNVGLTESVETIILSRKQREMLRVHTIRHNDHELARLQPPFGEKIDTKLLKSLGTTDKFVREVDAVVLKAHHVLAWTYPILYLQRPSNQRAMLEDFVIDLEKALEDLEQNISKIITRSWSHSGSKLVSLKSNVGRRTDQLVPYLMETEWRLDNTLVETIDTVLASRPA